MADGPGRVDVDDGLDTDVALLAEQVQGGLGGGRLGRAGERRVGQTFGIDGDLVGGGRHAVDGHRPTTSSAGVACPPRRVPAPTWHRHAVLAGGGPANLPAVRRLPLLVLVAAAATAGCSSSPSSTGSTPTSNASPAQATIAGSSTTASSAGGLPAVANATDLSKEPVISPGPSPAPTTLRTADLVVGTGATATASSTVDVRYVGADYSNGKVFDDTPWKQGQPSSFSLSGVIPGFAQGIVGMKVGGRREIVIPPALGYGAQGQPPAVGANETLVFVVDLVQVQ